MKIPVVTWNPRRRAGPVERFLAEPATDPRAERAARRVLEDVRRRGDAAVADCTRRFDGYTLPASGFRVAAAELRAARREVSPAFARAARDALRRVRAFARAQRRPDWSMRTPRGGRVGERFVPIGRVGIYVPTAAAPLASTVLMTVPLARVAGVPEICVCAPGGPSGTIDPHVRFALDLCGADEVYRIGGAQAVGAMAYGTPGVPRVDKIVGPGGPVVAAAKRLVYGGVAIDMVAGPSEIAVLADRSADPAHVAADLLSQAEHGTGYERTLLVTDAPGLAEAVRDGLARLVRETPGRRPTVQRVLAQRTLLVRVNGLDDGVDLINRFAPEHLELLVRRPRAVLARIRTAGAVFVGRWTPESAGDFVAGPSHVLPTGGSARRFSGLTVEDFRRRMSVQELSKADLRDLLPSIEAFSEVEGLPAHALSARARLERA